MLRKVFVIGADRKATYTVSVRLSTLGPICLSNAVLDL